jgi:Stress responsive A/B Barrel Domain
MQLRHIVLFGFKDGTSSETISEVVQRFSALRESVPNVSSFEWGANCSLEGLNNGHSHAFVLTFPSATARDAYLPHPAHQAFVEWVSPVIASATVIDYWIDGSVPA